MIGNDYWSTGIIVRYGYAAQGRTGWAAEVHYLDDGFCDDVPGEGIVSTEGRLMTRYMVPESPDGDVLGAIISVIKADAEGMGITWRDPCVYFRNENEDPRYPLPGNWREMIDVQAARLGWRSIYVRDGVS